jgi:acetyltransferase
MHKFFYPESVAVIGVSPRPGNLGKNIVANLGLFGFAGPVHYVSPRGGQWRGQKIYTDVRELPQTPELAVILTPAATVPELVEACGEKGIPRVVVESGGFSELAQERSGLEERLAQAARRHGLRFIGPNCIGVISTDSGLAVPFPLITKAPPPGGLSIVAQSGGVGLTYLHHFAEAGVGLAKFASVGNKLNVNEQDLLQYLIEDPRTEMILLYLESVVAGRQIFDLIRATDKPVVVHKSNIAPISNRIAASHTAALANDDDVVEAALAQAGAIRAHTVTDCLSIVKGLTVPRMKGKRVAVISRSGGHAVVAADAAHRRGMELPDFPPEYLAPIQERTRASVIKLQNPLDLGDLFDFHVNVEVLRGALGLPNIDGVLIVHGYRGPEIPASRDYVMEAGKLCRQHGKPVVLVILTDPEEMTEVTRLADLPVFPAPEEAMLALWGSQAAARVRAQAEPAPPGGLDLARAGQVLKSAEEGGELELPEALLLARAAGVEVAPFIVASNPAEAGDAAERLGMPVVLKAVGVSHKTDQGGVVLDLADRASVEKAADRMIARLGLSRVVVMQQVGGGQEVIIGAKQDPAFGPLILAGLGGVQAEVLRDVGLALAPVDADQARGMLEGLKGAALLKGFRGLPAADMEALSGAVARVSALAAGLPRLRELDLNPVLAGPGGVVAVDARAVVAPG